jgi:hypothetical protein
MLAPALQRAITHMFPGYRLPRLTEFNANALENCREEFGQRSLPFLCAGDFDGDGLTDVALLLVGPRRRYLVAAVPPRPDGSVGARCLYGRGDEGREEGYDAEKGGKLLLYLGRARRGVVDCLTGADEPSRMRLIHDGISVVWFGSAAHLYYVRRGRYHKVWTGD